MDGLLEGPLFMRDNENTALRAQTSAADFPVTLYDRPGLALSNIILRGDVDAATRAIFSPQSLTPAELKTFSSELLKDKRGKGHKLLKTIVDITTNPFVIMGVVMSLKFPVKGGTKAIWEIGQGIKTALSTTGTKIGMRAPGHLASLTYGGFDNLRNIKGGYQTMAGFIRTAANRSVGMSDDFAHIMDKYVAKAGHKLTEAEGLMASAYQQGFHLAEKKGIQKGFEGGTRHFVQKVHGIKKGGALWEGLQGQMSPALRGFADDMTNMYNKWWKFWQKNPAAFKKFQVDNKALGQYVNQYFPISPRYSRIEGAALYGKLETAKDYARALNDTSKNFVAGAFKKRAGLTVGRFEQLRKMEALGMNKWVDDLVKVMDKDVVRMEDLINKTWTQVAGLPSSQERATAFAKNIAESMTGWGLTSRARLGPDKAALEALKIAGHQVEAKAGNVKQFATRVREIAEQIMHPAQYDMRPIVATQRYINTTSRTWAWHIADFTPPGTKAAQVGYGRHIMHLAEQAAPGWQGEYISGQLIPLMRGFKPYKAMKRAIAVGGFKDNALTWLKTHPLPKKVLDSSSMNWLTRYFGDFQNISSESIGALISGNMYLSTLGLNVAPASKNLLQNWLTLMRTPGMTKEAIKEGLEEFGKKTGEFWKLTHGPNKLSKSKAFLKAFPDYVEHTGKATGMTKAMIAGGIEHEGTATVGAMGLKGVSETAKGVLLKPFSLSEQFNRLTGFYMAKRAHMLQGFSVAEAGEYGAMLNQVAHFTGGPLGMPRAILGMWAPARQFMHFPLRYAGFLGSSTTWGTGMSKFTPMAKVAGASAGAYLGAKNLMGIDISQGLAMGALPLPQYDKSPFYPWPLVPPAISVVGSAAMSIHKGETGDIKRAAALMVPGGLAMRRLYKTLGPKYAAYDSPTPDGRVPVYNEKKALVGAYTPWQLTMKSLGLAPTSQQAEYGAAKWLLTQREKIRDFRRKYLEAISANNQDKAGRINKEFQKAYPELGPLQIKKSDITAVHNRREISRLHRILKGFPKAYQPLFNQMVGQAGLSEMTADLERQPLAIDLYAPMLNNLK